MVLRRERRGWTGVGAGSPRTDEDAEALSEVWAVLFLPVPQKRRLLRLLEVPRVRVRLTAPPQTEPDGD